MTPVPGDNVVTQAIRVAGALAELSVISLELYRAPTVNAEQTKLQARLIDLPSMLTVAPIGSHLIAATLALKIEKQVTGLYWSCSDSQHATTFAEALSNA